MQPSLPEFAPWPVLRSYFQTSYIFCLVVGATSSQVSFPFIAMLGAYLPKTLINTLPLMPLFAAQSYMNFLIFSGRF
jgi:hypothetical protein